MITEQTEREGNLQPTRHSHITWPYGLSTRLPVFCCVHTSVVDQEVLFQLLSSKLQVGSLDLKHAHHGRKRKFIMKWPLFIRGGHAFSFRRVLPLSQTLSPVWRKVVFLPRRECEWTQHCSGWGKGTASMPFGKSVAFVHSITEGVMGKWNGRGVLQTLDSQEQAFSPCTRLSKKREKDRSQFHLAPQGHHLGQSLCFPGKRCWWPWKRQLEVWDTLWLVCVSIFGCCLLGRDLAGQCWL